ncbi:hypothetical protein ACQP2T_61360 [Nonomuraea sp. CA-143628]|uniref:hypothetical protein n=1 Tax=Nonomuraea sp. CA-143628 TaxID=3239997 RepID=UPI003D94FC29
MIPERRARWPVSIFTLLVTDLTGGKLSKTLYVAGGTYADLRELFLNLDVLLADRGKGTLDLIWAEVTRWAAEPRRGQQVWLAEAASKPHRGRSGSRGRHKCQCRLRRYL